MKDSLDKILDEFEPAETTERGKFKLGGPVTIWLTPEYKAKYDKIQKVSSRRFCAKLRELVHAAIDMTEAKAS